MSGRRTHHAGRSAASARTGRATVFVLSRLTLITQTVSAGLTGRGLPVEALGPAETGPGSSRVAGFARGDVAVLLDDLVDIADVRRACEMVAGSQARWLVLTGAAPGAAWGALLQSGARAVMSSSASLDEVDKAVVELLAGGEVMDSDTRNELLLAWAKVADAQQRLAQRMQRLSPHERDVLTMLYDGVRVSAIAARTGVAEATVRSQVKSMMRKLEVNSQLAAVASLHRLREFDPEWGQPPPHVPSPRAGRE